MSSKRVCVVLGGNGFIGSHIVDTLSQDENLTVRVFDRFERPPQFRSNPNIEIFTGSVLKENDLANVLRGSNFVIHSLAATNPFTADMDPYADIRSLEMSVHIFEACVRAKVEKITFLSSGGAIYGDMSENIVTDEKVRPNPISPYGICKLATEHYLQYFKRKYGIEYVVCRLANPYGPRQAFRKEQGVIASFLHHILEGQMIPVFGDGSSSRDYIFIEDAAAMIAQLAISPTKHHTYNIGSGKQISLNTIVKRFEEIFNKELPVMHFEEPKTFLKNTSISIERYMNEFGSPRVTNFQEGLQKTVGNLLASRKPEVVEAED